MNHSLWRDRKTQKSYRAYVASKPRAAVCEFCTLTPGDGQVVKVLDAFFVARNLYPYTIWDSFYVDEHLMLIPKRHVENIGALPAKDLISYGRLISEYEAQGYSIYGRAASNGARSVPHQHTHLIKVSRRRVHGLLYLRRFGITWFG